jgi:hypothetical protein
VKNLLITVDGEAMLSVPNNGSVDFMRNMAFSAIRFEREQIEALGTDE